MAKKPGNHRESWSKQDESTLKKMAPTRPAPLIANQLGRTVAAIRGKARALDVSFGRPERSPYGKPEIRRGRRKK
jgi:hypothetical protein